MTCDCGLADPLAGSDDCDRRQLERREDGRVEPEIGALVGDAESEGAACEGHPRGRPQHRLVRQVDDDVRRVLGDRSLEGRRQRYAVVGVAVELLGTAGQDGRHDVVAELDERVAHDRRVVLPVHDDDGAVHPRVVTSRSIMAVYFSYSSVSVENWMIRSCPWNGCLRQTSTWRPVISITL